MSKWYDFESGCPTECGNKRLNIQWRHSVCGSRQEVNENAMIRCKGSNCSATGHIMEYTFACENHVDEFKKFDLDRQAWALSVGSMPAVKGDKAWMRRFTLAVNNMVIAKM